MEPGHITIGWGSDGATKIEAPLHDKDLCIQILAQAIANISGYQARILLPPPSSPAKLTPNRR